MTSTAPAASSRLADKFDYVLLARHGQTEWNAAQRTQGQLDSPLTERGTAQARRLAQWAVDQQIDALFCSPRGRARSTAEPVAQALGRPAVVLDDLAELHHGAWAGLDHAEIEAQFPGHRAGRTHDKFGWRVPGGESYADAVPRAERAMSAVAASGCRRPLVISHAMLGRLLAMALLDLSAEAALAIGQPNDAVLRIQDGVVGVITI